MFPLWKAREKQQIFPNPSPKRKKHSIAALAQEPQTNQNGCRFLKFNNYASIEGTSLFTFLKQKISAGMTVEAAIVLPLFLFFFVNLSCALEMIRLQGNLELALWETGSKLSVYGHVLAADSSAEKGSKNGVWSEVGDAAFSYLYVKNEIIKYAGEEYLEQSPLTHGASGLQFLESEIFTEGDCFEIVMTYEVSAWMDIPGIKPFRMWNKYYGHIWNGYAIPREEEKGEAAGETVYVTENGVVYHKNINCTHLQLTVKEVDSKYVGEKRNGNGGKYSLCEKCGKGICPATVFIGVEGDRFHYDKSCSGLKRTFFSILLSEADKYRPCSRCSGI